MARVIIFRCLFFISQPERTPQTKDLLNKVYCSLDGKSDDFRWLLFISLSLRGLQTKDLLGSAIAVGCLPIREPPCACTGLPINLLLLLAEIGVVSTDVGLIAGNGANKFEYRPLWLLMAADTLLPLANLEVEVRSGVVISDVGSGRSVAMETLLLGLRICVVDCTGGLIAMEALLLGL